MKSGNFSEKLALSQEKAKKRRFFQELQLLKAYHSFMGSSHWQTRSSSRNSSLKSYHLNGLHLTCGSQ